MSSQRMSWSSPTLVAHVPLKTPPPSSGTACRTRHETSSERSSEENTCWNSHSLHHSPQLQLLQLAWLNNVWNWCSQIRWFNLAVVITTPLMSLYGAYTTTLKMQTLVFCIFCYLINMIGEQITLLQAPRHSKSHDCYYCMLVGITAGKQFNLLESPSSAFSVNNRLSRIP